jgi:hypothetical protein
MIPRRLYDKWDRFGVSAWLTALAATTLFGSLTGCATGLGTLDQNTAFTVDGHPKVGATQNACDGMSGYRELARTELYFGTSPADGARITEDQYQQFMDEEVTPRFTNSQLLLSGRSQFTGQNGTIVREPSKILILFYPYGDQNGAAVKEVMRAFQLQFQHETVQRSDGRACVSF